MKHPRDHIFQHTPETLGAWCAERSWPTFRAKQIFEWVYAKGIADPLAMTNIPARDRSELAHSMTFLSGETLAHQTASDGTQKLLLQWTDFNEPSSKNGLNLSLLPIENDPSRQTECVMIPTDSRRTACISSQVGCPVGCRFCASGLGGLDANLSAGRIIEQVWQLARLPDVGRISNIVFMGMGEPLANFASVMHAVRTLAAEWAMGISARKITISTVGLPKAIQRLATELDLPVTLALSLHAPNDQLRRSLIPWAEYTTIADLLDACSLWFDKTGREITLEYILLGGLNDQPEHAHQLAAIAKRIRANINLIRYNEVKGLPYARPATNDVLNFQEILKAHAVNAHIRASRGRDISAACGQLRHEKTASSS